MSFLLQTFTIEEEKRGPMDEKETTKAIQNTTLMERNVV